MIDEGYIKYQIDWKKGPAPSDDLGRIIEVRNLLYQRELIGEYKTEGIGYGNISQRSAPMPRFIVSGTQTGGIPTLGPAHFTLVTGYDLAKNQLSCTGPVKASSESLTHAAIYACDPGIGGVIHVHRLDLWKWMQTRYPCTPNSVPYGTPAMAEAVAQLYQESDLPQLQAFAMKGHEEGLFTFGETLDRALMVLDQVMAEMDMETGKLSETQVG